MFKIFNVFKKRKYLNCPLMKHSLHFFRNSICTCSSNTKGPSFYRHFKGGEVDWNFVFNIRKKYIKKINSPFSTNNIPLSCKFCCEVNNYLTDEKVDENFENKIDKLYFHNNLSCNAKCIYCTFSYFSRTEKYKVLPLVKSLIEQKILSENALVYMSGGEITISPEFEDLMNMLTSYLNSKIEILTSCIKFCSSIENAFREEKCRLLVSLDSGCRETYEKIKRVDCFDKVVDNLKVYVNASPSAKDNIVLKYIIIDDYNDNVDEINKFINIVKEIGNTTVRLDIDYEKYKITKDITVPEHYFNLIETFNNLAKQNNLNVQHCPIVEGILNKSRK